MVEQKIKVMTVELQPLRPKAWTYIIFIILMALLISGLSSCSPQWHMKKIIQKDPEFFKVDTTIERKIIEVPPVVTSFDCDALRTAEPIILQMPTQHDTVFLTLEKVAEGVKATVDCPDKEIITVKVPEPYAVYIKPTWQEQIKQNLKGAAIIILVLIGGWLLWKVIK